MKLKIVLFEDQEPKAQLLPALERGLGQKGTARLFVSSGTPEEGTMYEERLSAELSKPDYRDATLIVADRDLSLTHLYRGLSEETVRRVAYDLGIPECAYARGEPRGEDFRRIAEQREATIAVSVKDPDTFATQVVSIAEGFAYLAKGLPRALKTKGKRTLASLLAGILEKAEYAEKIALYASGDQNRLAGVLGVRGTRKEDIRRLSCLLGYWLWDSVLRYPGVLVNEVAASSYLNIHVDVFREDSAVQGLFEKARYAGPFAEAKRPMWWRGMLDDLVAESGCADGREFAAAKLKKAVPRSECCDDPSKPAGYYCMLSEQPVSLANSKGGLPWFPRGADLARISLKKYAEEMPWL